MTLASGSSGAPLFWVSHVNPEKIELAIVRRQDSQEYKGDSFIRAEPGPGSNQVIRTCSGERRAFPVRSEPLGPQGIEWS